MQVREEDTFRAQVFYTVLVTLAIILSQVVRTVCVRHNDLETFALKKEHAQCMLSLVGNVLQST